MMALNRRSIPILKEKKHQKGFQFIASRNFPYGSEFIRLYQNEVFPLTVKFRPKTPEVLVMLQSDISGEWADYEFKKAGELEYSYDLQCSRPGAFHFKIKYSLNQGKTWCLDNVPHSSLMVDSVGVKNLRMYTFIPTVSGPIGHWVLELERIKRLGFNAVHLLPVTLLDNSESPYSAADLFNLDRSYANPKDTRPLLDQFEAFVEKAKTLGIKLCLDIVLNHIGVSSKISRCSPDWIASSSNEPDGFKRAGCWDHLKWIEWADLALIKYDHPNKVVRKEIWDYMSEYLLFWANYADYTGGLVRLDNLHSTHRDFLDFALEKLREEFPNLTVFAELFTDQQTTHKMVFFHGLNLLLATPWVSPYADGFRNTISNMHANPKIRYLVPVNSHDSGTPAQEYGSPEAVVPRYAACSLLGSGSTTVVRIEGDQITDLRICVHIRNGISKPVRIGTYPRCREKQIEPVKKNHFMCRLLISKELCKNGKIWKFLTQFFESKVEKISMGAV
jgi:hypothetical protein